MVRINNHKEIQLRNTDYCYNILEYDLKKIAEIRKENAKTIENKLLKTIEIRILRSVNDYENQTPQTYPIIIEGKDKNEIYYKLNESGFGVVSLYHTMIKNLQNDKYKIANIISTKILNLPVHQDAQKEQIIQMCKKLKKLLGDSNEK